MIAYEQAWGKNVPYLSPYRRDIKFLLFELDGEGILGFPSPKKIKRG